jgi:hypothetical protein
MPIDVQSGTPRSGRHARPAGPAVGRGLDNYSDRSAERMRVAIRALRRAQAGVRSAGADSDAITKAFAEACASVSEAHTLLRETRKELMLVQHEYDELSRKPATHGRYPVAATPVIPDSPGQDLCPDPGNVQAPAEFMDCLRGYRTWSGMLSYRAMANVIENQCARKFSSSTLQAALTSDEMPSLQLVQAVLVACGAHSAHQRAFCSAWRRLTLSQPSDAS